MKWLPKVVYNAGVTFSFTISQRPWIPRSKAVGGFGVSSAGVPESYKQRRDQRLAMIIRFYEAELPNVMTWIEWCQDNAGTPFSLYLESTDVTPISCYLDSPTINEEVIPTRNPQYLKQYELTVIVRTVDGSRFTRAYL